MLMPKKNRNAIYEHLFKEGVMVAKKDYHAPKHPELETIPNLEVIKAMQTSRPRPAASKSESSRPAEDRAGYRRGPGGPPASGDKKADIGPGTADLEFRGGFGRGKAPQ
ncbi:Similar to RpS10: 40S ribosomal protein S10 (Spodoptera frugiperda) [Cotesia congregata]|uniref:Similar to RpS10: 40S ribosomal protein S10 (Spodoptera frugiperda) n=1 Tax=Cotesia congregata TaxID=51543 RepID=A0A8J2HLP6_COTCN|nr:Similar to RpS10: 40S ribosomal protein S10 (Spodoptera frugiperda) [Cotesia congregata]